MGEFFGLQDRNTPQWYGTKFAPAGGAMVGSIEVKPKLKYQSIYPENPSGSEGQSSAGARWSLPPPPASTNWNLKKGAVRLRAGQAVLPNQYTGVPTPKSSFFGGYPGRSFNT